MAPPEIDSFAFHNNANTRSLNTTRRTIPTLVINGVTVGTANQCKLLDVEISNTMSWQPQYEKIASKLTQSHLYVHHSQGCSVGKLPQTYIRRVC